MQRTSRGLIKAGGIISIVAACFYTIMSIAFFIMSLSAPLLKNLLEEGSAGSGSAGDDEAVMAVLVATFVACGIVFLVMTVLAIICASISFKSQDRQDSLKSMVLCIVFGALSSTYLSTAGGIVGVIFNKREARRQQQTIDVK